MESGKIADSALVASSRYNQYWGPEQGRLYQQNEGKNGSKRKKLNGHFKSAKLLPTLIYETVLK